MYQQILVIEDNKKALDLITAFFTDQGFAIATARDGREALDLMADQSPDLILLDIMMPRMDGYQFITTVRRTSNVPIIMLTAKRNEEDVVRGFELGADDYLTKPFRMRELLMRVKAVLRRSAALSSAEPSIPPEGALQLDKSHLTVAVGGKRVILTPAEFCVLERLVQSLELPVHRAALSTHLILHNFVGSESTIKIHIRNLRNKIESNPTSPRYIKTVFAVGYRLTCNE